MNQINLSAHASRRMQQRGVLPRLVQAIVDYHDVAFEAGAGCQVLRVSRKASAQAASNGLRCQDRDRLSGLALVMGRDGTQVVTVLHDRAGRAGRPYRRARN